MKFPLKMRGSSPTNQPTIHTSTPLFARAEEEKASPGVARAVYQAHLKAQSLAIEYLIQCTKILTPEPTVPMAWAGFSGGPE